MKTLVSIVALGFAASTASAATLTFGSQELTSQTSYSEADFTITATQGQFNLVEVDPAFDSSLASATRLSFDDDGGANADTFEITNDSGASFSFVGLDLWRQQESSDRGEAGDIFRIFGYRNNVLVGSQSMTAGTRNPDFDPITGTIAGQVDTLVVQLGDRRVSPALLDNIELGNITPAPIPLPASGLLVLGGLGAFAALRRGKAKKPA